MRNVSGEECCENSDNVITLYFGGGDNIVLEEPEKPIERVVEMLAENDYIDFNGIWVNTSQVAAVESGYPETDFTQNGDRE